MADVTFKCPNCGGYLNFDADSQQWKCPFCGSYFSEKELLAKDEQYHSEAVEEQEQSAQQDSGDVHQVVYHCTSCGSEIVTDETTVATHCYYCHNPVVLQGKMTGDMRPDYVLPFTISKEAAVKTFMEWVRKKRYVPNAFFNEQQVKNMSGVYYPHFKTDVELTGDLSGTASRSTVHEDRDFIVTTTLHYNIQRRGNTKFSNLMRPALTKANKKLSDAIHPFPLENLKPFSGAFLSGFLAERRDIDFADVRTDVAKEAQSYTNQVLRDTVSFSNLQGSVTSKVTRIQNKYVLLPTWVLTYPNPKDPEDPYYYAMNGCTGEVCGKLPIDSKKLRLHSFLWGLGVAAALLAIFYFFVG